MSRRVVAMAAGLGLIVAVLTVGHVSQALVEGEGALPTANPACEDTGDVEAAEGSDPELHVEEDEDGNVHHHYRKQTWDDRAPVECDEPVSGDEADAGSDQPDGADSDRAGSGDSDGADGAAGGHYTRGSGDGAGRGGGKAGDGGSGSGSGDAGAGSGSGGQDDNGLDVLARDCADSDLQPHDGFQEAPRCVSTGFGEVPAEELAPTLLITDAPDWVGVGEAFTIEVSTRNLIRDRFLPAAAGGYLLESSLLADDGLVRGHFHTACRILTSNQAPDPAPAPAFFAAVEDGGGGTEPDRVTVEIPGLEEPGMYQCTVWAGDGSHRVPMTARANQTPAVDSIRVTVS